MYSEMELNVSSDLEKQTSLDFLISETIPIHYSAQSF